MKNLTLLVIATLFISSFNSCKKYRDYENLDVIEDTFTGDLSISQERWLVSSDFTGTTSSGSYCFIWESPTRSAIIATELDGSGEIRFEIDDARGNIVLNETITAGELETFAFQTEKGPKGNWFIKVFFTDFFGEGSFTLDTDQ